MKKLTLLLPDEAKSVNLSFLMISQNNVGMTAGMIGLPERIPDQTFEMRRGLDSQGNIVYSITPKEAFEAVREDMPEQDF